MKNLIIIMFMALICGSCMHRQSSQRTVTGLTYDKITGEGLNGTFVLNASRGGGAVADSVGNFTITANVGDFIRFQYVGMKDSIIVLQDDSPLYWSVGLDTINTTMMDPDYHIGD